MFRHLKQRLVKFRRNHSDWIIERKQFSLSPPTWLGVWKPLEVSDCGKVTLRPVGLIQLWRSINILWAVTADILDPYSVGQVSNLIQWKKCKKTNIGFGFSAIVFKLLLSIVWDETYLKRTLWLVSNYCTTGVQTKTYIQTSQFAFRKEKRFAPIKV